MRQRLAAAFLLSATGLLAATLTAGPGKRFPSPCAAIKAAGDGDTIEVAAGEYLNEFCIINKGLTIRGVGGMATLRAVTAPTQYAGQAIWPVDAKGLRHVTLENLGFVNGRGTGNTAGVKINPDTNVTIRNCLFRGNETGLLASAGRQTIVVENTEFDHNGTGDGQTHNIYIGLIPEFRLSESWSHDSNGGQLVKSRAAKTTIAYSRFDGGANYVFDFSNGGEVLIVGSVVTKTTDERYNDATISFGREGLKYPVNRLRIVHSTIINERPESRFLAAQPSPTVECAFIDSVLQTGPGLAFVHNCAQWKQDGSVIWPLGLVGPDYRPLPNSPAIGKAVDIPETVDHGYAAPLAAEARAKWGQGATAGAYEGTGVAGPLPEPPPPQPSEISWRVVGGTLPPGMTLNKDGTLSGTPDVAGTYTVTIAGSHSGFAAGSKSFTIVVNPAPKTIEVVTGELPAATVGSPYKTRIEGALPK